MQSTRSSCSKADSLVLFLKELLSGISSIYQGCPVVWIQAQANRLDSDYEPCDLVQLAGYDLSAAYKIERIDACMVISLRKRIFHKSGRDCLAEFSKSSYKGQHYECIRIADPNQQMDHWLMVCLSGYRTLEDEPLLVESVTELILHQYLEKHAIFDLNRRIGRQFEQVFLAAEPTFYLNEHYEWVKASESFLLFEKQSKVSREELLSVVIPLLKTWDQVASAESKHKMLVSSFSIHIADLDLILMARFESLNRNWELVLTEDSVQQRRRARAQLLLTRRQYEAFQHFESGACCARSLSQRLRISPRTAERYRTIILHFIEHDLHPARGIY